MRQVLGAALIFCALALPTYAQDDLGARQAAAKQLVEITTTGTMIQSMEDAFWPPIRANIVQQNPNVTSDQLVAIQGVFANFTSEMMAEMSSDVVAFYTAEFSLEELTALVDFYKSPVGGKYRAKLPVLMSKVMPTLMQKAQAMGPHLKEAMREAAKERGLKLDI